MAYRNNIQSFSSTQRTVFTCENGKKVGTTDFKQNAEPINLPVDYSNCTSFFRRDLFGPKKAQLPLSENVRLQTIIDTFKDTDKVNVYNFACSDGSEPYSIAISLIELLGEEGAKKFFPIHASDFDSEILPKGEGAIPAYKEDLPVINQHSKNGISDYFDSYEKENQSYLVPKKNLAQKVEFECKDIIDALDDVKDGNSIILCRNCWPYLKGKTFEEFMQKLSKLPEGTMVVVGKYDCDSLYNNPIDIFPRLGFVKYDDSKQCFLYRKLYKGLNPQIAYQDLAKREMIR